mmetsp:Transcript_24452/g.30021  ORF Transcript_24452/g.30021 Transcript_24452/m.30021 type:complete len:1297 (-) Transcript_24452:410-4300(-)
MMLTSSAYANKLRDDNNSANNEPIRVSYDLSSYQDENKLSHEQENLCSVSPTNKDEHSRKMINGKNSSSQIIDSSFFRRQDLTPNLITADASKKFLEAASFSSLIYVTEPDTKPSRLRGSNRKERKNEILNKSKIDDKERKQCSTKSSYKHTFFTTLSNSLTQIAGLFEQGPGTYFDPSSRQEFSSDLVTVDAARLFLADASLTSTTHTIIASVEARSAPSAVSSVKNLEFSLRTTINNLTECAYDIYDKGPGTYFDPSARQIFPSDLATAEAAQLFLDEISFTPEINTSKALPETIHESTVGTTVSLENHVKNAFNGSLSNSMKRVAEIYDQGPGTYFDHSSRKALPSESITAERAHEFLNEASLNSAVYASKVSTGGLHKFLLALSVRVEKHAKNVFITSTSNSMKRFAELYDQGPGTYFDSSARVELSLDHITSERAQMFLEKASLLDFTIDRASNDKDNVRGLSLTNKMPNNEKRTKMRESNLAATIIGEGITTKNCPRVEISAYCATCREAMHLQVETSSSTLIHNNSDSSKAGHPQPIRYSRHIRTNTCHVGSETGLKLTVDADLEDIIADVPEFTSCIDDVATEVDRQINFQNKCLTSLLEKSPSLASPESTNSLKNTPSYDPNDPQEIKSSATAGSKFSVSQIFDDQEKSDILLKAKSSINSNKNEDANEMLFGSHSNFSDPEESNCFEEWVNQNVQMLTEEICAMESALENKKKMLRFAKMKQSQLVSMKPKCRNDILTNKSTHSDEDQTIISFLSSPSKAGGQESSTDDGISVDISNSICSDDDETILSSLSSHSNASSVSLDDEVEVVNQDVIMQASIADETDETDTTSTATREYSVHSIEPNKPVGRTDSDCSLSHLFDLSLLKDVKTPAKPYSDEISELDVETFALQVDKSLALELASFCSIDVTFNKHSSFFDPILSVVSSESNDADDAVQLVNNTTSNIRIESSESDYGQLLVRQKSSTEGENNVTDLDEGVEPFIERNAANIDRHSLNTVTTNLIDDTFSTLFSNDANLDLLLDDDDSALNVSFKSERRTHLIASDNEEGLGIDCNAVEVDNYPSDQSDVSTVKTSEQNSAINELRIQQYPNSGTRSDLTVNTHNEDPVLNTSIESVESDASQMMIQQNQSTEIHKELYTNINSGTKPDFTVNRNKENSSLNTGIKSLKSDTSQMTVHQDYITEVQREYFTKLKPIQKSPSNYSKRSKSLDKFKWRTSPLKKHRSILSEKISISKPHSFARTGVDESMPLIKPSRLGRSDYPARTKPLGDVGTKRTRKPYGLGFHLKECN